MNKQIDQLKRKVLRHATEDMTDEQSLDVGLRVVWMSAAVALLQTGYSVEQVSVMTIGDMKQVCETDFKIEHMDDPTQAATLQARLDAFIPPEVQQ